MPSVHSLVSSPDLTRYIRFTNGRIATGLDLVQQDIWVDLYSGKICEKPTYIGADSDVRVVDLRGRILSPGFIDVQINGAFGFDFSDPTCVEDPSTFKRSLSKLNHRLVQTGTTSYLPTMTSQFSRIYHNALQYLGPTGTTRNPAIGAESLGAHCEGPFFAHSQKGCHSPEAILSLGNTSGPALVTDVYGRSNLFPENDTKSLANVKMITLAPEREGALDTISLLAEHGVVASIGHTAATYEQAVLGVKAGSRMVTHLFNAMNQLHHRETGIFGLIAASKDRCFPSGLADDGRPYFGIIADGIHLHPSAVRLAWEAHPHGLILITDAVMFMGLDDGTYQWTNGQRTVKEGMTLKLEGTETLAGSAVDLPSCINNLIKWTGCSISAALRAVTETPAEVLGLSGIKGSLVAGADADLVVLEEADIHDAGAVPQLEVRSVWKFGTEVYSSGL